MAAPSEFCELSKVDDNDCSQKLNDDPNEKQRLSPDVKDSDDAELDELLDSALQDFKKPAARGEPLPPPSQPSSTQSSTSSTSLNATSTNKPTPSMPHPSSSADLFDELFSGEGADDPSIQEFSAAMKQFMEQDPDMMKEFDKLVQAASTEQDEDDDEASKRLSDHLTQTLSGLSSNPSQGGSETDSEFMRAFSSMNLDPGAAGPGGGPADSSFIPMVQGMMHTLMSKEILYPAISEMSAKYPQWLKDHKLTVTPADLTRYTKQMGLMQRICGEFESESPTDGDIMKANRFDTIVSLMQQMQELGQPPKDIVGEMAPGLQLDANGLPTIPGSQTPCCLM